MQGYPLNSGDSNDLFDSTPLTNFERNLNMRRFSLGNVNFQGSAVPLKSELSSISPRLSFLQDPIEQQLNQNQPMKFSSVLNPKTIESQDTFRSQSSLLAYQQQIQEQQEQQSQENIASYLRYRGINSQNELNRQYSAQNIFQQSNKISDNANKLSNMRRRSVAGPIINTSLLPVYESRSSSPIFSYSHQHQYQQQKFENKLSSLSSITGSNQSLKMNKQPSFSNIKSRFRALHSERNSLYEPNASLNNSTSFHHLDNLEEKLATTGNIFQRREDWSILTKIPISKQNTIHIRIGRLKSYFFLKITNFLNLNFVNRG